MLMIHSKVWFIIKNLRDFPFKMLANFPAVTSKKQNMQFCGYLGSVREFTKVIHQRQRLPLI